VLSDVVVDTGSRNALSAKLVRHELRGCARSAPLRPTAYVSLRHVGLPWRRSARCWPAALHPALSMFGITVLGAPWVCTVDAQGGIQSAAFPGPARRDALSLGLWLWSFITVSAMAREPLPGFTRDGSVQPVEGRDGK